MNHYVGMPALPAFISEGGVHGAVGDIWYQGAGGVWVRLPIPGDHASVTYVLGIAAGVPAWIALGSIVTGAGFGSDFGSNFGND
jgi:hypothetical protein